jgi:hypothetical protein
VTIRTVHVVFKTHLDLGFTDSAAEVVRAYREQFIPGAIRLARELEQTTGSARFVWTTGAWLIADGLAQADMAARDDLDRAIREGHIVWHALPFTTHTEMLDVGMARHALSIAGRLDARYGRHTVAAKLTDVPGHTIGLVPQLAAAGVTYLHIGTNPTSATPVVPETFVWRAPDGSEVVVSYASTYGAGTPTAIEVPGSDQALHVTMTNDNHGPPPAEQVIALFAELARQYPNAEIRASRLDDFAAAVWPVRDRLPVITEEIGDTWIHGIASDPLLLSHYRALQRWRADRVADGALVPGEPAHDAFADGLLRVPEHTWGMDQKSYLPDYVHWSKPEFAAARARDVITLADVPTALAPYAPTEARPDGYTFSRIEASWQEQREHLDHAIATLPAGLAADARAAIATTRDVHDDEPTRGEPLKLGIPHELDGWLITVAEDGAIAGLVDPRGNLVADHDHPIARYAYTIYDESDFDRWFATYHENLETERWWAVPDFGKPGLGATGVLHTSFSPRATELRRVGKTSLVVKMEMPSSATEDAGAPRRLMLGYEVGPETLDVRLDWRDKDAHRMPEASWLTFGPLVRDDDSARWRLDKLGTEVDPAAVVSRGNRALHAVGRGAWRRSATQTMELTLVDAALVAVGRQRLVEFDDAPADPSGPVHVLLHDNVWGTNFPLWSSDDQTFRFRLAWS